MIAVDEHVTDLETAARSSIDAGQTVCAVDAQTLLDLVLEVQRLRDELPDPPDIPSFLGGTIVMIMGNRAHAIDDQRQRLCRLPEGLVPRLPRRRRGMIEWPSPKSGELWPAFPCQECVARLAALMH